MEPFETRVIEDIRAGDVSVLALDSLQEIEGKGVQIYKVDKSKLEDDIAF